ncbi:hypothetical protein LCGC14_0566590 [marine sediment metagenome]|uniref:Uncharacterized protein n=1 Tax=marine sediment metagenome TaxID=412755 RepID=A0A0F9UTN7_9ZZZZ|nr:MAG: hypothetical protein Lokiarch_08090 [Candidatus Lokiarchaeum sp. GC14_75]
MRPSRVFRLIFRIFILLLTISMTVVTLLGGWSAILILSNPNNIQVDPGSAEFNFDVNFTSGYVENVNFSLPVNITNAGYFDMENLGLNVQISINYSHIDWGGPGVNVTRSVTILDFQNMTIGDILKGTTGNLVFFVDNSSFIHGDFPNLATEINWFRSPSAVEFYANFTISLDYSLGMHSLAITAVNLIVGSFSLP